MIHISMYKSKPTTARVQGRSQTGFGLVELMVSITIGLVMLAALVALFVNASRNNREMATANSVIENGRFAIELLESDIVHAGFWGTFVPEFDDQTFKAAPGSLPPEDEVPDPCLPYDEGIWVTGNPYVNSLLGIPVQVYDSAAVCAGVVQDMLPGTDMIVVRHAETCVPGEALGASGTAGVCERDDDPANRELFIQAALCADDLLAARRYEFGRANPPGVAPFELRRGNCIAPAEKRRFVSNIYYVRTWAATPGDGIRTLVRSEFNFAGGVLAHQSPEPLIEGIEGLRFELGIDNISITNQVLTYADFAAKIDWDDPETQRRATNRGDGVPDESFVRCAGAPCTPFELMNVVAVKIHVLARSRDETRGYTDAKTYTLGAADPVGPFNDSFKRHVYSTTVRLHNIAGRRERP